MDNYDIIPLDITPLGDGGFHIFCSITIENKEVVALVDTGANRSVLSNKLAEVLSDLESIEIDENHTSGIGKEEVDTQFIIASDITIGNTSIPPTIVGLINLDHVDSMYEEMGIEPFQMIIGGDILQQFNAIINYGTSELMLNKDIMTNDSRLED